MAVLQIFHMEYPVLIITDKYKNQSDKNQDFKVIFLPVFSSEIYPYHPG